MKFIGISDFMRSSFDSHELEKLITFNVFDKYQYYKKYSSAFMVFISLPVFNGINHLSYRGRLESNADQWLHLVNTLQELIGWVLEKQQELMSQRPLGGDNGALQRQNLDNQVKLFIVCMLY